MLRSRPGNSTNKRAGEVGLRDAQATVNRFADILGFQGLRIAADVDADHPHLRFAADDRASLSSHTASQTRKATHAADA